MKNHPFKVRKVTGAAQHEFKISLPTDTDETELIQKRFGSRIRMVDRANAQLIVDVAPGVRKRLPDVPEAQRYIDGFCANGAKDSYRPKVDKAAAKKQKFTPENMAFLKSIGVDVE